jgi:hypothetical protein
MEKPGVAVNGERQPVDQGSGFMTEVVADSVLRRICAAHFDVIAEVRIHCSDAAKRPLEVASVEAPSLDSRRPSLGVRESRGIEPCVS